MPYTAKLPPNEFGLKGAFDYFMVVLKPLLTYRDMKTGVFQTLREVGNAIAFAQLLQQSYVRSSLPNNIDSSPKPNMLLDPTPLRREKRPEPLL